MEPSRPTLRPLDLNRAWPAGELPWSGVSASAIRADVAESSESAWPSPLTQHGPAAPRRRRRSLGGTACSGPAGACAAPAGTARMLDRTGRPHAQRRHRGRSGNRAGPGGGARKRTSTSASIETEALALRRDRAEGDRESRRRSAPYVGLPGGTSACGSAWQRGRPAGAGAEAALRTRRRPGRPRRFGRRAHAVAEGPPPRRPVRAAAAAPTTRRRAARGNGVLGALPCEAGASGGGSSYPADDAPGSARTVRGWASAGLGRRRGFVPRQEPRREQQGQRRGSRTHREARRCSVVTQHRIARRHHGDGRRRTTSRACPRFPASRGRSAVMPAAGMIAAAAP